MPYESHEIEICTENGVYFGVLADFFVEWKDAEPDVGVMISTADATFRSFNMGYDTIDRGRLISWVGILDVESIEEIISEKITADGYVPHNADDRDAA